MVVKVTHMCMVMRGVQKPSAWTITSAMRGVFLAEDGWTREAFLNLVRHNSNFH